MLFRSLWKDVLPLFLVDSVLHFTRQVRCLYELILFLLLAVLSLAGLLDVGSCVVQKVGGVTIALKKHALRALLYVRVHFLIPITGILVVAFV